MIQIDMPMPKSCWECRLYVPQFCPATKAEKGSGFVQKNLKTGELKNKPAWCPLESADRPQGDVDAVAILMREMHNLDQGYITISEFDERIEPLRHLCYGRPQGKWIETFRDEYCGTDEEHEAIYRKVREYMCDQCGNSEYTTKNFCSNCGARMKGADYEQ